MVWVKICGITNIKDADQISAMGADAIGFIFSSLSKRKINFADAEEIIHFLKNKYELNSYSVRRNGNYNCRNKNYNNNYNNYNNYDNCDGKMPAIVGVFVNEEIDVVIKNTVLLNLDFVQFSGDEDVNYLNKFNQKIKKEFQYFKEINNFSKNYKKDLDLNNNLNNIKQTLKDNNLNYKKLINRGNNLVKLIKLIRIDTSKINSDYTDNSDIKEKLIKEISKFKNLVDYFLLDTYKDNVYGGTGETFSWETIHDFGKYFPVILAGGLSPENVKEAINIVKPFGVDASSKLEVEPGKKDIKKVSEFIKNVKSDLI
jgi:phosphoribosylanthranilate isomerase